MQETIENQLQESLLNQDPDIHALIKQEEKDKKNTLN